MRKINETSLHKELRLEAQFSRGAQLKIIELRNRIAEMAKEYPERTKNDVQLIAACPDLIAALLGLRNFTNDGGCWCDAFTAGQSDHDVTCRDARAVIAARQKQ